MHLFLIENKLLLTFSSSVFKLHITVKVITSPSKIVDIVAPLSPRNKE